MFDFKELEAFVWIVRLGSFRQAARHLHLTQPSISDRIARLEDTLGEQILERNQRPIKPTLRGREFFRHAEEMLQARQKALLPFQPESSFSGTFHLGVVETIVHSWLPAFLTDLSRRYPAMTLELEVDTTTRLLQRLQSHELDLAFVTGPVELEDSLHQRLCSYPVSFITRPSLLQSVGSKEELLERYPLLTYPRDSRPFLELQGLLYGAGLSHIKVHNSGSLWTIVRLAMAGFGIGVIPPVICAPELARGELSLVDMPISPPNLNFYSLWSPGHDSYIAEAISAHAVSFDKEKAVDFYR